jgi:DNA gyrase subunit A
MLKAVMKHVKGPDFPTGALIVGQQGIKDAFTTGRGSVKMRAVCEVEEGPKGHPRIIVTELPYQVNKARLATKIAEMVNKKEIEGITGLWDESSGKGMRLVIDLKKTAVPQVVLNTLYKRTQLQDNFSVNMLALVDGIPRTLNLAEVIDEYVKHQVDVIVRRTKYRLRKAEERAHILEGLIIALDHIDEIIELIRNAADTTEARQGLMARFGLSEVQSDHILDMPLKRLTALEQDKIRDEYREVIATITDLLDILAKPARITKIIDDELRKLKEAFADKRKSEIVTVAEDISIEDLIAPQDMVVTFSHGGYVKSQPLTDYRAQRRGGRGRSATSMKEDDFIERLFVAHSHDYLLCFSNRGRLYWLKVYEVPAGSRASRGKPIVNMFPLEEGEKITAVVPVKEFDENHYVFMATAQGTVKKTALADFSRPRPSGIIAVGLDAGDYLVGAALTDGKYDVMLFSSEGKAVRFEEGEVRPMGRQATGVRGMRLDEGQRVVCMLAATDETKSVLTATANGYGKRTPIADYPRHGRGGQGVIAIQISERNGELVGAVLVDGHEEVMLISTGGVLIRTAVAQIREQGRSTQGVTLIALGEGEKLAGVERIEEQDGDDGNGGNGGDGEPPLAEGQSPPPTVH